MPSRVLTVMFTDIKGFTERTSKSSRIELRDILKEHEELLLPTVRDFGGRVVKTGGDSFMVAFESPTNAVLCGVMMQDRLRDRNRELPEGERLEVRVAINTGEVMEREGDVFGEAVNIAARIEGITEASEIYFTESTYLAMNKAEVPSSEVGLRRLKGVPEAVKVYRVIQDRHSDKYQRLVERLRSGAFADVAIPSTGEPAKAARWTGPFRKAGLAGAALAAVVVVSAAILLLGREPVPAEPLEPAAETTPDPVAEAAGAVREAVEAGELGLALARAEAMLREHPTRKESHDALRAAVEAEVRVLVEKDRFDDALDLIETRRQSQSYVKFAELEREVLLQYASWGARRGNYRVAGPACRRLMKEYPEDLEVLRAVIQNLGPGSNIGFTSLSEAAACRIAELTEGPLEEPVARTLAARLRRYHPDHECAVEARRLLAERYPPAADILRQELGSDDRNTRMNSCLFLKSSGLLTPQEELGVHVKNLTALSVSDSYDRKYLEPALDYLEQASAGRDWQERKGALGMGPITRVAALRGSGELVERVSRLLSEAFLPEIRPSLQKWIEGADFTYRRAAFHILKAAGLEGDVDVWAYHARHLKLDDYSYQYRYLHEAISFFREQAGTPRADEARGLLEAAREAMMEQRKKVAYRQGNFEANLKAVDEALGAFE